MRCNNWLGPDVVAGDGGNLSTRQVYIPQTPTGSRGSNRPLGASWCHSRPMRDTADDSFAPAPPASRQTSPAGSEVDEPLVSAADHRYGSNGQPLWGSSLSADLDPSNCLSNNGHDHNCSAVGAGNGTFRTVVLPVGERFIIRRNGKWYGTAARTSVTTCPSVSPAPPLSGFSVARCLTAWLALIANHVGT
eukprot:COSAG02_NODE_5806_length_4023_cov_5.908002_3_plen_191_part_00